MAVVSPIATAETAKYKIGGKIGDFMALLCTCNMTDEQKILLFFVLIGLIVSVKYMTYVLKNSVEKDDNSQKD